MISPLKISPFATKSSGGGAFDPDAAAFFTAASITDATEKSAVNQLVLDLKADNIWTKIIALYPFVGGSSSSCSYNLKNPAQFQIDWYGGMTFNSNGITGNGVNSYGNTHVTTNINLPDVSSHFILYNRTQCTASGWHGAFNGSTIIGINTNNMWIGSYNFGASGIPYQNGFFGMSATPPSTSKNYINDGSIITWSASSFPNNLEMYIMSLNVLGGPGYPAAHNVAFHSLGLSLSDGEMATYRGLIQTFQTTLGRQV